MRYVVLFLLGLGGLALAADPPEITVIVENDHPYWSLFGSDRGYTNGVAAFYAASADRALWGLDKMASALAVEKAPLSVSWGLGMGQNMYTPANLSNPHPIYSDRPYAGWLYLTGYETWRTHKTLQTLLLEAGIVGPWSLAEEAQEFVHRGFGFKTPEGWSNQIHNEPGLVVLYQQSYRWIEKRWMDLAPSATVAFGNVVTYVAGGIRFRIGPALSDNFGPTLVVPAVTYAPIPSHDRWELYFFVGVQGRYVAHDITLDGNTFAESPSIPRRPFIAEAEEGFSARYRRFRFCWRLFQATPAFYPDTRFQTIGSFQFSYRFD